MKIYREIIKSLHNYGTANVVIAGQTCSGKTTLSNKIKHYFDCYYSITIISQDDYFKNRDDFPINQYGYLMDSPNAFHISEFQQDVHTLLYNSVVAIPRYDIRTNTRIDKQKIVHVGQINIFEGLHAIEILNLTNSLKIYLDTPAEICLKRRIQRDTELLGVSEKQVKNYWNTCIYPTSIEFIYPQSNKADILL